jgi:aminoglycoside 6'-N-acetyltransferase
MLTKLRGSSSAPYDAAKAPSWHPDPDPDPDPDPVTGLPDDAPVDLRPLTRADFPLLAAWFGAPHVEPWWQEPWGLDDLEDRYGPAIDGTDPTEAPIVTLDGRPIGLVIRYRIADNGDWRITLAATGAPLDGFGIDYLIGDPDLIGQGVGTRLITTFVTDSLGPYPEGPACVVGVHGHNRRSGRALERAGFSRVWTGALVSGDLSDAGPQVI